MHQPLFHSKNVIAWSICICMIYIFIIISCFNLLKCLNFLFVCFFGILFSQLVDTLKRGCFWRVSMFLNFFYFFLLFKSSFLSLEWQSLSRMYEDNTFFFFFLLSLSSPWSEFWLRYFFNKEIASKKTPIRDFEFNYIFTKRDCYVVNL